MCKNKSSVCRWPSDPYKSLNLSFYLISSKLENINCFKYLGCILKFDFDDSLDILQRLSSFNKSFGVLSRKFHSVNSKILYSLFLSFCSSFYGAELWCFRDGSKFREAFKKMSVDHCALNKILGVPKFYSNHLVCSVLSAVTFQHLVNFRITRFAFRLKYCNSVCNLSIILFTIRNLLTIFISFDISRTGL